MRRIQKGLVAESRAMRLWFLMAKRKSKIFYVIWSNGDALVTLWGLPSRDPLIFLLRYHDYIFVVLQGVTPNLFNGSIVTVFVWA